MEIPGPHYTCRVVLAVTAIQWPQPLDRFTTPELNQYFGTAAGGMIARHNRHARAFVFVGYLPGVEGSHSLIVGMQPFFCLPNANVAAVLLDTLRNVPY